MKPFTWFILIWIACFILAIGIIAAATIFDKISQKRAGKRETFKYD